MATAKKSVKKPAKKNAVKAKAVNATTAADTDTLRNLVAAPVGTRRRGRPPGSVNKNKKAGKKPAGRPAATKFLYSLSPVGSDSGDDGLGLTAPVKIEVVGPFPSEEDAMGEALGQIGTRPDIEVTLYRDYRKGRVEVKTRLV